MPLVVTLRRAQETDSDFVYEVRERSMRTYVEQTWKQWNEASVRTQIAKDIHSHELSVIEVNCQRCGVMRIDDLATHIDINQLFLLPEHQNHGVGGGLVREVLASAAGRGIPVRLWVLRVNPARSLYERLGFRVVEETPTSFRLQSAA